MRPRTLVRCLGGRESWIMHYNQLKTRIKEVTCAH